MVDRDSGDLIESSMRAAHQRARRVATLRVIVPARSARFHSLVWKVCNLSLLPKFGLESAIAHYIKDRSDSFTLESTRGCFDSLRNERLVRLKCICCVSVQYPVFDG